MGHHQRGAFPLRRADCAEDIGGSRALILRGAGSGSAPGPAAGDLVLLHNPGLVLEPYFYWLTLFRCNFRQAGGEVFLNAAMLA